jgi:hypothetical protein
MKYQKPSKGSELPKVGKFADNEKNQPSWNQQCPGLAKPEDFEITTNGGQGSNQPPFHGHEGNTAGERKRLLKPSQGAKRHTEIDEHGRAFATSEE